MDDTGRVVHDRAVVRSEAYLVSWSGVSTRAGAAVVFKAGVMKGVLTGCEEPSTVAFGAT